MPLVMKPLKRVSEIDFDRVDLIAGELCISRLLAQVLYNRGYDTPEKCRDFLYIDEKSLLDPFSMLNMDKLCEEIKKAEKITVYGDYDADGVCATAIMLTALKRIGKDASYYIPHRVDEGYGLHEKALDKIFDKGCDLLVTVDCGISSVELIKQQREKGRNIAVTDHHTVGDVLPDCIVINPHREDDGYKNPDLCGAGIAFKVAQALLGSGADDLIDFAGIATMADIVPLTGENRYIAKKTIELLNGTPRPSLKALIDAVGIKDEITAQKLAFGVIPRINAVGRIDNASNMLEYLLSEENLCEKAAFFNELNAKRKSICEGILKEARAEIAEKKLAQKHGVLMLWNEGWHLGVIGICATTLAEEYNRPCILFSVKDGMANGSARSVDGVNLYELLSGVKDILEHFGGHKMAAGLGCRVDKLEELNLRLDTIITEGYDGKLFYPSAEYDAKATVGEITVDFINSLKLLQPCGCQNNDVLLRIDGCGISSPKTIGSDNTHLRMELNDATGTAAAVVFYYEALNCDFFNLSRATVVASPSLNEWNGKKNVQLQVKNAKPCDNIQPRDYAERLTALYYSRLAVKKTGRAQINYITDREELEYQIASWGDDEISGTLILCDLPEYAADCIRLLENEAPRFDISYSKPINEKCGYNSLVVGMEKIDFTPFRRVLLYDLLNVGYADFIAEQAPWLEIYAYKCGTDVFNSIFEEYKAFDRNSMAAAYKAITANKGNAPSRSGLVAQIANGSALTQPVISVALDTFSELGFIKLNDDFSVIVNKDAPKHRLEDSGFYSSMLKCIKK